MLFLFRRMFYNPPGRRRVRASQRLVSPSPLLGCSASFFSIFKLSPHLYVSLSKAPACHGSDPLRLPSSAAPGRFSLPKHQDFIPERKTILGTAGDQMYIPEPTSWLQLEVGTRGSRRERTGSPLTTTNCRHPSSTTDCLSVGT